MPLPANARKQRSQQEQEQAGWDLAGNIVVFGVFLPAGVLGLIYLVYTTFFK